MKYLIGRVLKPRGLRGELKVQILTNLDQAFSDLKIVKIDKTNFVVSQSSIQNGFAYLKLAGITTVESAEDFRDKNIYATKSQLKLGKDDILVDDLVGYSILSTHGRMLGILQSVESYGERVILNVGKYSFPYEDDFVDETNTVDRVIIIHEEMLRTEVIR